MIINGAGSDYRAKFTELVDNFQMNDRFNLSGLYIALERESKELFKKGLLKEGEAFPIPLENGNTLEMRFYKEYSTLNQIAKDRTTHLISKKDSFAKEYNALYAVEDMAKASMIGIGYAHPEHLAEYLGNVKPGEILIAGKDALVCTFNMGGNVSFAKRSFKTETPRISELSKAESVCVVLNSYISVQEFYRNTRNRVTESAEYRVETLTTAQQLLNRLFAGDSTKQIKLGPNRFYAQKENGQMRYFGEDGVEIPEETLKITIAWLNRAPVITEYRKTKSGTIDFQDKTLASNVEKLLNEGNYPKAFSTLLSYQESKNDNKPITFKSYIRQGNDYKAIAFTFKNINGICKVYKSEFENDDFTGKESFVPVTSKDFRSFCSEKYEQNYALMISIHKSEIYNQYPNCKGDLADKIAQRLSIKDTLFANSNIEYSSYAEESLLDAYEDR